MKRCIFCPNPRTMKHGEHIWDDWLNRENGKDIRRLGTVTHLGLHDVPIREYRTNRLEVASDVVCDPCNNEWMSVLSSEAKTRLEPIIRRDLASDFDELDIVT